MPFISMSAPRMWIGPLTVLTVTSESTPVPRVSTPEPFASSSAAMRILPVSDPFAASVDRPQSINSRRPSAATVMVREATTMAPLASMYAASPLLAVSTRISTFAPVTSPESCSPAVVPPPAARPLALISTSPPAWMIPAEERPTPWVALSLLSVMSLPACISPFTLKPVLLVRVTFSSALMAPSTQTSPAPVTDRPASSTSPM